MLSHHERGPCDSPVIPQYQYPTSTLTASNAHQQAHMNLASICLSIYACLRQYRIAIGAKQLADGPSTVSRLSLRKQSAWPYTLASAIRAHRSSQIEDTNGIPRVETVEWSPKVGISLAQINPWLRYANERNMFRTLDRIQGFVKEERPFSVYATLQVRLHEQ